MAIDLAKQVGPMPLGAWVAVIGTGLGIAIYSNRNADPSYDPERDTSIDPGVGVGGTGDWIDVDPPEEPEPVSVDNDDWGREAVNYLIARGHSPAEADLAIRKYLNGERLSLREAALLNIALRQFGSPPYPLPPGPRIPTIPRPPTIRKPTNKRPTRQPPKGLRWAATTTPSIRNNYDATAVATSLASLGVTVGRVVGPADIRKGLRKLGWGSSVLKNITGADAQRILEATRKPSQPKKGTPPVRKGERYHVVKPGNTLAGLAQKYYGNSKEWNRIYNANRGKISNPNRITVGQKLLIP